MNIKDSQTTVFDPSFGVNGKLEVRPPGNFRNDLSTVTFDTNGRMLVYGAFQREPFVNLQPGVARLIDDGAFDTGFGDMNDGLITSPNTTATSASGIAILADGSFCITGAVSKDLPIINYDANGKFISNWGDVVQDQQYAIPKMLAFDDKFLIATANINGGVIYRRHYDGSSDSSFGNEGKVTFLTGSNYLSTLHMTRSVSSSSFYMAGEVGNNGFILRMTRAGEQDQSFADGGVYSVRMIGARFTACRRVIELSNGKILALVNSSGAENGAACHLIRLTATGRIDATFNRGEPLRVPGEVGEDLTLQADGKILVTHRGLMTGNQLTRYLPMGEVDEEFGEGASGSIIFTGEQLSFVKSVAVQPDGKIIIGGTWGSTTSILRLLA